MLSLVRKYLICILSAALLLLAVRGLLVTHMRLPADHAVGDLPAGSHVWVTLTNYGLRLPGESLWGYHRWGYGAPQVGETLLFTDLYRDEGRNLYERPMAGICRALPGDTIWTDPVRRLILPGRTSPDALPFIIPGRHTATSVTPHNARLLARLMRRYEQCPVKVDERGRLWLRRQQVHSIHTTRDYYWIETLPDQYTLVPHDALVGRIHPMKWPLPRRN